MSNLYKFIWWLEKFKVMWAEDHYRILKAQSTELDRRYQQELNAEREAIKNLASKISSVTVNRQRDRTICVTVSVDARMFDGRISEERAYLADYVADHVRHELGRCVVIR